MLTAVTGIKWGDEGKGPGKFLILGGQQFGGHTP